MLTAARQNSDNNRLRVSEHFYRSDSNVSRSDCLLSTTG